MKTKLTAMLGLKKARPGRDLRRAGNLARDGRDWAAANAAYADYLVLNPDDWQIWVQRGHAQKEMGDLASAERSYRRAADIAPTEPDPFLQLGGLMDRMHLQSASIDYYRRAASLGDPDAQRELSNRGIQIDLETDGRPKRLPWVTKQTLSRTLLEAQAARDLKRWEEAEALYLIYLASHPECRDVQSELEFVRQKAREH